MAEIQFSRGTAEEVIPEIRLTRSKDGTNGQALFYFDQPRAMSSDGSVEVTGMYMVDEEGEISTREVNAKFINGQPAALEATYIMKNVEEWDRFMRFMKRYAEQNELGFNKA
ncbi:MAG: photosystem II reaction center protein Psb28 [Pegethrix bostrychoides GSE-TBD4-15B]|jgi:photosystem II protein|uniref:Photosystem II reaction center Psb28 protein n=1 Tax=Pegethrix bostrychoides GSE-TBD4-15B TaxID=2839662 RepID=A0A951PE34_9CYAN|nr:photosystem II reaction center protein Psb28 [Pegethrix bostrychoides GSE-TBD4-15B]